MGSTFRQIVGMAFVMYIIACALSVPAHLIASYLEAQDCRVAHDVEVCMYVMQPVENSND